VLEFFGLDTLAAALFVVADMNGALNGKGHCFSLERNGGYYHDQVYYFQYLMFNEGQIAQMVHAKD